MPEPAPGVPWMVRPDTVNLHFPWSWICEDRIQTGLVNERCSARGPATTEEQANAKALAHAREAHGYRPDAAGEDAR